MQTSKEERAQWTELCAKAMPGKAVAYRKLSGKCTLLVGGTNILDSGDPLNNVANALHLEAARTALPRLLADFDELERKVREFLTACPGCGGSGRGVDGGVDVGPCHFCAALRAAVEQK